MITLSRTAARDALNELAASLPADLVTRKGRYWHFLTGALAPGASVQIEEDGDRATIDLVYVEANRRRHGDARTALNRVLEAMDAQPGGVEMDLIVSPTPLRGSDFDTMAEEHVLIRFYESLGFEDAGENDDFQPYLVRRAGGIR